MRGTIKCYIGNNYRDLACGKRQFFVIAVNCCTLHFCCRREYIELLKVCLCIQKGWGGHMTQPLGVLMDAMVEDCGMEETWDILLSSSFQMSTSETDISAVCQSLGRAAKLRPKV